MANAELEVVSLIVPPSWNDTNELNDPSDALVLQSRSVTRTNHEPSIAFLGVCRFDSASPTAPDINTPVNPMIAATPPAPMVFRRLIFIVPPPAGAAPA